ncbi:sigma-70 family RNA polymerase sigma factor [Nannocystis sp. ILAH1]|uniref:RNA polymerase sigma factor n=1 Tax=unclassified Nannocystis TaxID=2627009 RepID=UPI00226FE2E4|nr:MULTISPECIES: sigma-70 family RNA polymerase sigma factor [unclassified Nannocystis]MCY0989298.1 sigma-70 family RNA polymerase sigma factor [Nannocystis sp. ILAH1]MCY1065007.1 sigma-70 family RNA polymerase sigma factor [Nannocystis sp. RBIL2]
MSGRAAVSKVHGIDAVGGDGDVAALLDRLYRRHHRAVYQLALRYGLGNEAWAEDVVQDVFLTLFDRLPTLADVEQLDGWLYRVTTNRCLRKLRRDSFLNRPLVRWLLARDRVAEASPEQQVFARRDLERARSALAALPARERVVVGMCHLDGKSQREVCETLGLSKGYVSKLLARALARLEEALDD